MKKLLFSAILATVAIGGGYAQQMYTQNADGSGFRFICSLEELPTCREISGGAYEYPSGIYVYPLPDLFYDEI
ncbi:hypothetical protein [Pedobacter hiemivivus]|uniref:Uncharacterized protein n=1 Tax=Pedobacter hiemivivus TaxID=2530454 RepID=A0A4R0MMC2_9SPHI|nr:hypothetical protein [Pedobacter hiemivivus]TCC87850.1 hypothetical protein EZ444_22225 [Pedobacter hiemivivus]